jgi:hypothetical protein
MEEKEKLQEEERQFKESDDNEEKCKHCGRAGHDPDKCWMLDKNKGKCPEWLILRNITGRRNLKCSSESVTRLPRTYVDGDEFSKRFGHLGES